MPASVVLIVLASLVAVTVWVFVGVKYGQAPSAKSEQLDAIEKRLARLEVAIDDMTSELLRVSEGQQFVTKLLGERSSEASHASR